MAISTSSVRCPTILADLGLDVVVVDLPGHGLSDGDEPEPGPGAWLR